MSDAVIPLRCMCGNAMLRPRLKHEETASEIVVGSCPACDCDCQSSEIFYTRRDGELLTYERWMRYRGLEP